MTKETNKLKTKIIEIIKNRGPITFERFMRMALYDSEFGYYMRPETKIGRKGDFYTSPHMHPIFGAMLGIEMKRMWEFMDMPPDFTIVEIAGGHGYLSKDMLDYLKKDDFFKSLSYVIVELNPFLKEKQKSLLVEYHGKVSWVSSISEVNNIKGCILSNELLDAFPVHLVETENGLKEIYVSINDNELIEFKDAPSTPDLEAYLNEFRAELPEGYRTEINLRIKDWLKTVSSRLSNGFVLTIDYGYSALDYYSEERDRGTLLCYHKHEVSENPYELVGSKDITSHVNFSSLKKFGNELGLKTIGICPQGTYLVSSGIDEAITELYAHSPDYLDEVLKIKGLIMPGTMGESHKVLIQYKGDGMPLIRGFQLRNQARYL